MIETEESKVSVNAILISKHNEFILQERDDNPAIVNPGMWSLFGGTVKPSETNWSGLRRELFEELELTYKGSQVEIFNTYKKTLAKDGHEKTCVIYIIRNIELRQLVLHEGKSIIIDRLDTILENRDKISKVSLQALEDYKAKYKL